MHLSSIRLLKYKIFFFFGLAGYCLLVIVVWCDCAPLPCVNWACGFVCADVRSPLSPLCNLCNQRFFFCNFCSILSRPVLVSFEISYGAHPLHSIVMSPVEKQNCTVHAKVRRFELNLQSRGLPNREDIDMVDLDKGYSRHKKRRYVSIHLRETLIRRSTLIACL